MMRPVSIKFHQLSFCTSHMLGAIKLPSSGVSQNKFFNGPYPMSRLLGPTIWKFFGAVDPQWGRNQLSSRVYANKTL